MWKKVWKSAKKVAPLWVTIISLILAIWPMPSGFNFQVQMNLRLILAIIVINALAIMMLIDFSTTIYNENMQADEHVQNVVRKLNHDGEIYYLVYIYCLFDI